MTQACLLQEHGAPDDGSALPPEPWPPERAADLGCPLSLLRGLMRLELHFAFVAPVAIVALVASVPLATVASLRRGEYLHAVIIFFINLFWIVPIVLVWILVGVYQSALGIAADPSFNLYLLPLLLVAVPWPWGRNIKVVSHSKSRRVEATRRMVGLAHAGDAGVAAGRRKNTKQLWDALIEGGAYNDDSLAALHAATGEVDLNFPSPAGSTRLALACERGHLKSATHLLAHGADPNVQDWYGNTVLHRSLIKKDGPGSTDEEERSPISALLLSSPCTDPCVYNYKDKTAYMCSSSAESIAALRPPVRRAFATIESSLANRAVSERAVALCQLVPRGMELVALRLPDLLFCTHEGDADELLLAPMLQEATRRLLSKEEKALVIYAWGASMGPPKNPSEDAACHCRSACLCSLQVHARDGHRAQGCDGGLLSGAGACALGAAN